MAVHSSLAVKDWHRLNRLLERALEVDAGDRIAWFAALPAESSDLRPLLEDLLARSGSASLEGTSETLQPVVRMAAEVLAGMRREQPGDRIGPWRLERMLAEGGMGTVWLAERSDGVMQRRAALKLPRAEWVDRGLSERIARERSILALLQHANIAVLYDAGVTERGRPYLALEYVEGQPIDEYCREHVLDFNALLCLFVQVVRAVASAHNKLVVHRDLKPSNVLVTAGGQPKLLDFGIAKLLEADTPTTNETALTRLVGRPLTLRYAAPEQILGQPISVAADIYALGVMLYELLSNTRPYQASSDNKRALEQEILNGLVARPSSVLTDKSRARALHGDLDAIVLKALKKKPEERYETAAALADDIERHLNGQPVIAQPDSRPYRLRKFIARNRIPVAAGSAIVIALGIGLSVALWQASVARAQAARATAMNEFVLSLIRQADPRASQASKAADLEMLRAIEQRVEKDFRGSPLELLQLRMAVGDAYQGRGQHEAARLITRRAVEEAQASLPPDDLRLLKARAAGAFYMQADDEMVKDIDSLIERLRSAGPAATEALVDALLARVQMARHFARRPGITWDSLYKDSREALELTAGQLNAGTGRQLQAASSLAALLIEDFGASRKTSDRAKEAFEVLDTALARAGTDPQVGEANPDLLVAQGMHAGYLCQRGNPAEGLRRLWDNVATSRAHHADDAFALESAYTQIARCLTVLDDADAPWYRARAYEVAAKRNTTPFNLSRLALDTGEGMCNAIRPVECAEFAAKAGLHFADMPASELKTHSQDRLRTLQVRALIYQGETERAEELATESLLNPGCCEAALRRQLGVAQRSNGKFAESGRSANEALMLARRDGRNVLMPMFDLAVAELNMDRPAKALVLMEEALPILLDRQPFPSDVWANIHLAYGRALLASGRAEESLEPLRRAYGFRLGRAPQDAHTANAEYWFGQAYIAVGDVKRGRWMVNEAKQALGKSPYRNYQLLAQKPTP